MNYLFTFFAVVGLFVNPKYPAYSFLIWFSTNTYWLIYAYRINNRAQMIMFAAFTLSCAIQWLRLG